MPLARRAVLLSGLLNPGSTTAYMLLLRANGRRSIAGAWLSAAAAVPPACMKEQRHSSLSVPKI